MNVFPSFSVPQFGGSGGRGNHYLLSAFISHSFGSAIFKLPGTVSHTGDITLILLNFRSTLVTLSVLPFGP